MGRFRRIALTASVGALLAVLMVGLRPDFSGVVAGVLSPRHSVEAVGSDAYVAHIAESFLWLTACWLSVGIAATVFTLRSGRQAGLLYQLSRHATPRVLRQLVATSVGASVLLMPIAASAAAPQGSTQASAPAAFPSEAAPTWPMDGPATPVPAPRWPTASPTPALTGIAPPGDTSVSATPGSRAGTTGTSSSGSAGQAQVSRTGVGSGQPAAKPSASTPPTSPTQGHAPPSDVPPPSDVNNSPALPTVTVHPGDSLWSITADSLGPDASAAAIAVEWPYWYRANRKVIGSDPGLLQPGDKLSPPNPGAH
jgi:hypothetical protein